jgi:hypothetical protein
MRELGFKEINNLNGGYNELIQFTEECWVNDKKP